MRAQLSRNRWGPFFGLGRLDLFPPPHLLFFYLALVFIAWISFHV